MNIALIGYNTEGSVTYDYFEAGGHEITICDQNPALQTPEGAESVLGDRYLDDLDRFDIIIRSAGIPPSVILEKNPGVASKITTHINEFFKVSPTKNIIGVTGTKGKGTTSTLIASMLEAAGKTVRLGGNIGIPPLSFLDELDADSWVVLELSSFQLIDLQYSPHIALCLMVVPEHLNWHEDIDEYTGAKAQLFTHQLSGDIAIYFAESELSKSISGAGLGTKLPFYALPGAIVDNGVITIENNAICNTSELKLLGMHNWQNACAAVTVLWQIVQDVQVINSVLTSFSGLPHRIQFVREHEGITYYDDSFGTTPETAMVAIQAFAQPVIAIIGGQSKGIPFDALAQTVVEQAVKKVVLIGETAQDIQQELERAGFPDQDIIAGGSTMQEIVQSARAVAAPGDVVLLSTGCASFDMFDDYIARGEQFSQAVQALA